MENGCLSDYLRSQRGSFSKETLLGMCQDVCEGMAYLEQNSVIHRDLVCWWQTDFSSAAAGLFPLLPPFLNFSFCTPAHLLTGDQVLPLIAEAASILQKTNKKPKHVLWRADESISLNCVWERRNEDTKFVSFSELTLLLPESPNSHSSQGLDHSSCLNESAKKTYFNICIDISF